MDERIVSGGAAGEESTGVTAIVARTVATEFCGAAEIGEKQIPARRNLVFNDGAKVSCRRLFKLFKIKLLPTSAINVMIESRVKSVVAA